MIPSPILKVLSTIQKRGVRALMMGGQACILYGAAEFSRDLDLAILADGKNLERLRHALRDLKAEPVYVPPLGLEALRRGHGCHFRVPFPAPRGVRVDVMSRMNNCPSFAVMWARRRRIRVQGLGVIDVLALEDLVSAKKTQRDKDWPVVARLIAVDYANRSRRPSPAKIKFWLLEARTPELLADVCRTYNNAAKRLASKRTAIRWALLSNLEKTRHALQEEEQAWRDADRAYWQPLRTELFHWRQSQRGAETD